MALTITAPVAVAHSGESDPALTPQGSVGSPLPDVVGASATSAGNITVRVTSDEANCDVSVTFVATLLTYTSAGKFSYIPLAPGMYTITVTDVTAGTSVSTTVEVFQSSGV